MQVTQGSVILLKDSDLVQTPSHLPAALTPTLQFLVDASSLCQRRAACLAISLCSVMSGLRTNENRLVGTEELEDRKAHPKSKTLMSSD